MIKCPSIRAVIGLVLLCADASAVLAQERPLRSFRRLFGVREGDPTSRQSMDLNASLLAGRDDNLLLPPDQTSATVDPRYQLGGLYSALNVGVSYARGKQPIAISATAGGDLRYYPDLRELMAPTSQAAASIAAAAGPLQFRAQQGVSYSPYYAVTLFPELVEPGLETIRAPMADFAINRLQRYGYLSTAGVTYDFSSQTALNVAYHRLAFDFEHGGIDSSERGLGASLTQRLTRHAAFRIGYGQRRTDYAGDAPIRTHDLDIGLDYRIALSPSNRTSLSLGSGSSAMSDGERMRYHVTGAATLNHDMGRSWSARLVYDRGLRFLEGFADPFFSDAWSAGAGGFLNRRLELSFLGSYAAGASGLLAERSKYDSYTGTSKVRVALGRHAAFDTEYFYYHYRFRGGGYRVPGLPGEIDRHGVRAGLTLWVPLLRQAR